MSAENPNVNDDAWRAHARLIPLIHSTDAAHLPATIEELLMAVEFLSERAGVRVRDLWPIIQKRVAERKDAEYHAIFARDAAEKELRAKNQKWLIELGDEPIRDAMVLVENGGVFPIEKFVCSICKKPVLTSEAAKKFVQAHYRHRQVSLATKTELATMIRNELLDGRTSTYVDCGKCGNTTSYFRLTTGGRQ